MPLIGSSHSYRRRLGLLGILVAASMCASCLPMTQRYYAPSAEGADVVSTTCAGGPPYAARLWSDRIAVLVFLDSPTLSVQIRTNGLESVIELDPTVIRATADSEGRTVKPIRYTTGRSGGTTALDAVGPIRVLADQLTIHLSLETNRSTNIVVHLPPITLNGKVSNFPDISFKWEEKRQFVAIVVNC